MLKLFRGLYLLACYSCYNFACSLLYTRFSHRSSSDCSLADCFLERGFAEIDTFLPFTLFSSIRSIFENENVLCLSVSDGFSYSIAPASASYPYCYLTNSQIARLSLHRYLLESSLYVDICSLMNTWLKIANISVWTTYPNSFYEGGSFTWHRDNMPPGSLKIIVNINSVDSKSGAFNILGFTNKSFYNIPTFSNTRYPHLPLSCATPSHTVFIGGEGSTILFDPNCIHYAGRTVSTKSIFLTYHLQSHHCPSINLHSKHGFPSTPSLEYGYFPWKEWWHNSQ